MEHYIRTFAWVMVFIVGHFVRGLKIFTPKLINLKTAFVHIKVYVSFFKIRRASLPNHRFRMECLHRQPCSVADAFAVRFWGDKQEIEIASLALYLDYDTADRLPVLHDPIGLATINGLFNGLSGDDFALFLEVVVAATEFLQCAVIERLLIIQNELVSVVRSQRYK